MINWYLIILFDLIFRVIVVDAVLPDTSGILLIQKWCCFVVFMCIITVSCM